MTTSNEVPFPYDVAIDGHPYVLDSWKSIYTSSPYTSGHETIPLLRSQSDTGALPGEQSVNPEDLWTRGQRSWHRGAGQEFADRDISDPYRFRLSKGINVWTQNRLSLLHSTTKVRTSTFGVPKLLTVNGDVFAITQNTLLRTVSGDVTNWAPITLPAGNPLDMTTDGITTYVSVVGQGVVTVASGATSYTAFNVDAVTTLGYVKGRLMGALANKIYNFTAGSATAATPLYTHPNSAFQWVGFSEGPGFIYAAGYAGDKSLIYKTAVKSDGTALDVPVVAGELPEGEVITAIQGYLGFLVVGVRTGTNATNSGFRLASIDASGNLTFGARISLGSWVSCFEPQDRFIYFGWSGYDTAGSGLGRMDLSQFTAANVPAYASDLMATSGALTATSSVVALNGKLLFAVPSVGIYAESTGLVPSGSLDTGYFEFGLPESKIGLRLDIKHPALPSGGSIAAYISSNRGSPVLVGTLTGSNPVDSISFELPAYSHEVHILVNSGETGNDIFLDRYDLRAYPTARRGEVAEVPLLLFDSLDVNGLEVTMNPREEYDRLRSYVGSATLVDYQELGWSDRAIIQDLQFQRNKPTSDRSWWNGVAICKIKFLGGA